jgi:cysteine-rich repeat protein
MSTAFHSAAFGAVLLAAVAALGSTACDDTTTPEPGGSGGVGGTHQGGGGSGGLTGGTGGTSTGGGGSGVGGGSVHTEDTCPGEPSHLHTGQAIATGSDMSWLHDDYSSNCGGDGAPDAVYQVIATETGTFTITVDAYGTLLDPLIYMRTTCDDPGTTLWCHDDQAGTNETLAINLDPGTYYLFVDGANQTSGAYDVTLGYTVPECGDGATNANESCDDGNTVSGDGCSSTCQLE